MLKEQAPLSVSQCVAVLNEYLGAIHLLAVRGEVSGFRVTKDHLVFFELKDSRSRLLCFFIRWEIATPIEDGMEVVVEGEPRLFQTSGGFHMRARSVEPVGDGALLRAYELLKKALEKEGLFHASRKRALPSFPEHVGVITSAESAAWTDVKKVLKNRWPYARITLFPICVQGMLAIPEIVGAIRYCNALADAPCVLILTRGGGSLEDLQPFNAERVCRAVAASRIPVVCAIGHERDVTLAELAADRRAATPSNGCECAVPDQYAVAASLFGFRRILSQAAERRVHAYRAMTERHVASITLAISARGNCVRRMTHRFGGALRASEQRIRYARETICGRAYAFSLCVRHVFQSRRDALRTLRKRLASVHPSATLRRGYTITRQRGKSISAAKAVRRSEPIKTCFYDGEITSRVLDE